MPLHLLKAIFNVSRGERQVKHVEYVLVFITEWVETQVLMEKGKGGIYLFKIKRYALGH